MSKPKTVLVEYSGLGPVSMPLGQNAGAVYAIKPGPNEIPLDTWDVFKKSKDVQAMLERGKKAPKGHDKKTGVGNLVVKGKEPKKDAPIDEKTGLAALSAAEAKEMVAQTYDTPQLRAWLEQESTEERPRASVINAVEKQLKIIEDEREKNGEKKQKQ